MYILLILFAPLFVYFVYEIVNYKKKQLVNKFNGPPALPLIGNALQIGKTPHEILYKLFEWWQEYGNGNFRLWIGQFANVIIAEVEDVEYILTSNEMIMKSDIYDMVHPWLGRGLLTSYGSKWHKHRKMITPAFHFKILQNFHEVMNSNSNKFIEKLRLVSDGDSIFDMQEMVNYLTLDVICETAMGVKVDAMDNHDSKIVTAFRDMCTNINMRAFHPIKRINSLYRFAPDYPEYKKVLKFLQDFTNNVIEMRKAALKESTNQKETDTDEFSKKKLAFLDTLLTATIDNRPLTQQEVYEEVSTFIFEGHDTTTSGITFALYLLSRHPHIQAKVYEEQKQVMGGNLKRDATFQEISDMKYLDLFIKESQRLYPSVPFIGRQTDKDYNMNGKIVPKGTSVNLFIIAMGYNEKSFPDPFRCNPDRFDTEKNGIKMNPFQYVPFSAGPRNCIGQKFAMLELKTVVSKVVRHFEILPPLDELISKDGYVEHYFGVSPEEELKRRPNRSKYDPILSAILTLKSDNGVAMRLKERA